MSSGVIRSIGFPRMHKEDGEKRDFLPPFFADLMKVDVDVYLEEGYGEKLGYSKKDYLDNHPRIQFVSTEHVYKQQLVVIIRSPEIETIRTMSPGSGLMTMLHYDTRPVLLQALKDHGIHAFSLDAIVDDDFKRQVVTYEMTAYGGMREAFRALAEFTDNDTKPDAMKVTILGMGQLGVQAARYAYHCYREFDMQQRGWQGISVEFLEKEITSFPDSVKRILEGTDILADATRRPDPTQLIIPNEWLASLPEHAVILDLTADPYEVRSTGIQVKAIEGIPTGNLDKYTFNPQHSNDYANIPASVSSQNRRVTISCNAWPGVVPRQCMQEYGKKIKPFLQLLLHNGFTLNPAADDNSERALYRSTIPYFHNK